MIPSLKKKIMDRLMVPQQNYLVAKDKEILKESIMVDKSVLFSRVMMSKKHRNKAKEVCWTNLPFPDFMVLADVESYDPETGQSETKKNGMLFRLRKVNDNKVRLYFYGGRSEELGFTCVVVYDVNVQTGELKRVAPAHEETWFNDLITQVKITIMECLWAITHFQSTSSITPTFTHAMKKKIREQDMSSYVEYTLDLNTAKRYPSRYLGGTHASPREHVRRGHYRRTRSGNVVFVEAVVVNAGSKRGVVEKDYQL